MPSRSPITTHVLDTARGRPCAGLAVVLEFRRLAGWSTLASGVTDGDGRVEGLLPPHRPLEPGTYRLTFDTAPLGGFWPEVAVAFTVTEPDQHYHVPLLLSPFGYSTYRGS